MITFAIVARQAERSPVKKTLDRMLSKAGLGSRTEARRWIADGRVAVNGRVVTDSERWVDPQMDRIALDGEPLRAARRVYLLLHKPPGYLTTYRDPKGRKTVYELLPSRHAYLFPVGRLDLETSGLLIMTNDSAFAEAVSNPSGKVPKTYRVRSSASLTDAQLEALSSGVNLSDGPTRPARVVRLQHRERGTVFEITITEGRNRQVRRMVESLGAEVVELARVAIGGIRIGSLPPGASRPLRPDEVIRLAPTTARRGARSVRHGK